MTDAETATGGQVIALAADRLGGPISDDRLDRAVKTLVEEGRIAPIGERRGERAFSAIDTYRIVGELVRRTAAWHLRKNVRGGFEAWVTGDTLGQRIMLLPWQRGWDKVRGEETLTIPTMIRCSEFPTGRHTGNLVRGGDEGGLPVFAWHAVDGSGGARDAS